MELVLLEAQVAYEVWAFLDVEGFGVVARVARVEAFAQLRAAAVVAILRLDFFVALFAAGGSLLCIDHTGFLHYRLILLLRLADLHLGFFPSAI